MVVIRLRNKIEEANAIYDKNERGLALEEVSKALAENEHVDKAIEIANTIPGNDIRQRAFRAMRAMLVKNRNIGEAVKVEEYIPLLGVAGARDYFEVQLRGLEPALLKEGTTSPGDTPLAWLHTWLHNVLGKCKKA